MPNFTMRGPARLGSTENDEHFTHHVVARLASIPEDVAKVDGPRLAAEVLPARRALWRVAEQVVPAALAASLRARCSPTDQTGRGGVREFREALADWLDPPLRCRRCHRPIRAGTEQVGCPAAPDPGQHAQRGGVTRQRLPCRARTGRPCDTRGNGATRDSRGTVRDGLTMSLFNPLQLDPACAAAAKAIKHGSAGAPAYDLAVDRDCRILLAALTAPAHAPHLPFRLPLATHPRPLTRADDQRERAVQAARRAFDRALDLAFKANGRLVLGMQAKHFAPHGSVTRADLLQGGAAGLRRALLDYDPRVAKISTYAVNWIFQGMGEVFGGRDSVDVPDWARRMRRAVEDLGVDPAILLGLLDALPEAWGLRDEPPGPKDPAGPPLLSPWALVAACYEVAAHVIPGILAARERAARKAKAASAVELGHGPDPDLHSLAAALCAAAVGPTRKPRPLERAERAEERVAFVVAQALLLGPRAKGGALLTALRYGGMQVVVEAGSGERDDAGGGVSDDSTPGAGRKDRVPEHLSEDADDAEERAAEEQEQAHRWRSMLSALEQVRVADPEAAEVVRRRHGLDGGEPETYEEIAATGLACTGRYPCRESVRKLYVSATKAMEARVTSATIDEETGPSPRPSEAATRALGVFVRRRRASSEPPAVPLDEPTHTVPKRRAKVDRRAVVDAHPLAVGSPVELATR